MADQLVNASVYLNTDVSTSGDLLKVSATPALSSIWKSVLVDLGEEIPTSSSSEKRSTYLGVDIANGPYGDIYDANTDRMIASRSDKNIGSNIGTLGSGSDYTVFLDRLGIACIDFYFAPSAVGYSLQYGERDIHVPFVYCPVYET